MPKNDFVEMHATHPPQDHEMVDASFCILDYPPDFDRVEFHDAELRRFYAWYHELSNGYLRWVFKDEIACKVVGKLARFDIWLRQDRKMAPLQYNSFVSKKDSTLWKIEFEPLKPRGSK